MREDSSRLSRRIKSGEKELGELRRKAEEGEGRVAGLQEQLEALTDAQVGPGGGLRCLCCLLVYRLGSVWLCCRPCFCWSVPHSVHCTTPISTGHAGEGAQAGRQEAAASARAGGRVQPHQAGLF